MYQERCWRGSAEPLGEGEGAPLVLDPGIPSAIHGRGGVAPVLVHPRVVSTGEAWQRGG